MGRLLIGAALFHGLEKSEVADQAGCIVQAARNNPISRTKVKCYPGALHRGELIHHLPLAQTTAPKRVIQVQFINTDCEVIDQIIAAIEPINKDIRVQTSR